MRPRLSLLYWLVLLILPFLSYFIVIELDNSCEYYLKREPESINQDKNSSFFSESIARSHLRYITSLGARTAGSINNEIHTPKYFLKIFQELQILSNSLPHLQVTFDEHISQQGSFVMYFLHSSEMTSLYRGVRNLVLRLHDKRLTTNSDTAADDNPGAILVNCHYDSVVESPGASDDFISCSVMLELIRVMLIRQSPLKYDIIFLFNGAEENLMQASHAFVTQHKWMKNVKTFINLEGAGAAGRLFLFQSGPNAPWLVEEFAKSAETPFASILGQEIFQSGLIPSDTDYRIFRDYAHLPGVDFAFIKNGYIYHTPQDHEKRIPPACLQLAGDNILSFLLHLSQSPYVAQPNEYHGGDVIFFDFFGFFMIAYHEGTSWLLNLTILLTGAWSIYWQYTKAKSSTIIQSIQMGACGDNSLSSSLSATKTQTTTATTSSSSLIFLIFKSIGNHLLALILQLGFALLIALFMSANERYLTWYALRFNLIGLYIMPMLCTFFLYHGWISTKLFQWKKQDKELIQASHHIVAHSFLLLTLIICMFYRIHSAYLLVIWLLTLFISKFVLHYVELYFIGMPTITTTNNNSTTSTFSLSMNEIVYTIWRIVFYTFPIAYLMYRAWGCHDVFIPILGRSGPLINPEIFMVILLFITTFLLPLQLAGDVYITHKSSLRRLNSILIHVTISLILCIYFTSIGFPYREQNGLFSRQQRIIGIHTKRINYDIHDNIASVDNGLWIIFMDKNGRNYAKDYLTNLSTTPIMSCQSDRPFCGQPHLYPLADLFSNGYFIPSDSPPIEAIQPMPKIDVLSIKSLPLNENLINVTIVLLDGPPHNHIVIRTNENVDHLQLIAWSVLNKTPLPIDMPSTSSGEHYFIYNGYGEKPKEPLIIWLLFEFLKPIEIVKESTFQVALLASYFNDDKNFKSPELKKLLKEMPPWSVPVTWSAVYANRQILVTRQ